MLRRVLFNKSSIRKFSSIYDKNNYKKYYNYFKKIDLDLILWNFYTCKGFLRNSCIGGGIIGSGYSSYYLGYKETVDTSSYPKTIFMTTIMGWWGFGMGFISVYTFPFWMPFAMATAIFKYLDPHPPLIKN